MWILLAFASAALLGCYDVFKKQALRNNAVLPTLFLNALFCALLFLPLMLLSAAGALPAASLCHVPAMPPGAHCYILLKAVIVLSSWTLGYFGIKHLPLTLVGPINATRPVMVLCGSVLLFGERLNLWQWAGVMLAVLAFFLLSRTGRKEGIHFTSDRWIGCIALAAVLGAASGLYDKFLLAPADQGGLGLHNMTVQVWYNLYQCALMFSLLLVIWWPRRARQPFRFRWAIVGISVFLSLADFAYFYALSHPDALIAVVSMVRRGSVLVSFAFGALFLHEKNLRAKALDLILVLLSLLCLYLGSR